VEAHVSADQFVLGIMFLIGVLGILFLCWVLVELVKEGRKQSTGEMSVERIRRRIVAHRTGRPGPL
jgi:flagellar biogenesis protein FliO